MISIATGILLFLASHLFRILRLYIILGESHPKFSFLVLLHNVATCIAYRSYAMAYECVLVIGMLLMGKGGMIPSTLLSLVIIRLFDSLSIFLIVYACIPSMASGGVMIFLICLFISCLLLLIAMVPILSAIQAFLMCSFLKNKVMDLIFHSICKAYRIFESMPWRNSGMSLLMMLLTACVWSCECGAYCIVSSSANDGIFAMVSRIGASIMIMQPTLDVSHSIFSSTLIATTAVCIIVYMLSKFFKGYDHA